MKQKMQSILILTVITIFGVALSTSCTSPANETKSAETTKSVGAAAAGENKSVEIKETPKTEPKSDVPNFKKEEDYKTGVREKLLKAGWQPARSETDGKENCVTDSEVCRNFPELEAGPSSPLGQAILRWKKGDKIILIRTIDSFIYDGYEFEKPKKSPVAKMPDISGTYIYESKHEYGTDRYFWELSSDFKVLYSGEVEGGDFPNQAGKWSWDATKQEIIVNMLDGKRGVYIFKLEDNSLKLIKEPKLPEGVTGFVGTIYKKK